MTSAEAVSWPSGQSLHEAIRRRVGQQEHEAWFRSMGIVS